MKRQEGEAWLISPLAGQASPSTAVKGCNRTTINRGYQLRVLHEYRTAGADRERRGPSGEAEASGASANRRARVIWLLSAAAGSVYPAFSAPVGAAFSGRGLPTKQLHGQPHVRRLLRQRLRDTARVPSLWKTDRARHHKRRRRTTRSFALVATIQAWPRTPSISVRSHEPRSSSRGASTSSAASGETSSLRRRTRTPSSSRTRGRSTPNGISD
jgi:hypothetical protein